jgi:hypothetical protein
VQVGDTVTLSSPAADTLPAGSVVVVGRTDFLRGNDGRWRDEEGVPFDTLPDANPLGRIARIGHRRPYPPFGVWNDAHVAAQQSEITDLCRELAEIDAALGLIDEAPRDRYKGDRVAAIRALIRRAAQ